MLSIFLAEQLEETAISQNKLFLQYFCDSKDERRNTAVAVLRGLIYQLLKSRPKLFDHILPDFKIQKTSLFTFETLWRIFESIVHDATLETTYCVLDGVDECEEASVEILLGKFAALFSAKTDELLACHLNLLIVCRGLPDFIPNLLSGFHRISLDLDASAEVKNDIDIFIEAKVDELSRYRQYPEPLRVHVAKVFRDRAEGTFLWIGIVAKELGKYRKTEVQEALDTFPPGLDQLYARILLQIDSGRRNIAAIILRWVVMAVRPLTLSELSLAIEPTLNSPIVANRDERIRDQVSYCGDILVTKGSVVRLIHQSAKDYLLSKTCDSNSELELFHVKKDVANLEIASRCLGYLQSGALENMKPSDLSDEENLIRFPLLSYAAFHWHEHASFLARSADVFDLSQPFWKKESESRTSWLKAYWYSELDNRYGLFGPPDSFPLLHIASYLGLLPLVQNLIHQKGWINKIKRLSTLNKPDSQGMTAMMWAVRGGHDAVVRLLLEKGADIEIKAKYREMALPMAVKRGHDSIVHLLLEKGANINAKGMHGETALMNAARTGNKALMQRLLENGADTNAENNLGWTALTIAPNRDYVWLLLEYGADVNAKDHLGSTALMKQVWHGDINAVRMLLESGANTNAANILGQTALMNAAEVRSNFPETAIRLLLEKGADINAENNDGETALAIAIREREMTEDGSVMSHYSSLYPESEAKHYLEVRKSILDSIIQMLLLHSETHPSI